jgi:hypothetical protein
MPTSLVRVVETARPKFDDPGVVVVQSAPVTVRERKGDLIQNFQRGTHAVVTARPSRPSYDEMALAVAGESATWYSIIVLVVIGRLLWATARTIMRGDGSSAPSRSSG